MNIYIKVSQIKQKEKKSKKFAMWNTKIVASWCSLRHTHIMHDILESESNFLIS